MDGLQGDIWPFLEADVAADLVSEYFGTGRHAAAPPAFSGAYFESFGGGGDAPARRARFDSDDLVAVTFLGVKVPGWAALRILQTDPAMSNGLLGEIPHDVDLWETAVSVFSTDSAAQKLWDLMEGLPGIGWVTVGKLLARKRPRLFPVYDEVVKEALMPNRRGFWLSLREELQDPVLRNRLRDIQEQAGLTHRISLLRVLDVAVWMRNRGILQVNAEARSVRPLPFTAKPRRHGR